MTAPAQFRNQEGFTLVELLIVVLIIGLLASIVVPVFNGQRNRSKDAVTQSAARQAFGAARSYYTDKESYGAFDGNTSAATQTAGNTLLRQFESSLSNTPALPTSVSAANGPTPPRIYVHGSPAAKDWVVVCANGRGLYTYCIVHDSSAAGYTRYGKSTGDINATFSVTTATSKW